MPQQTASTTITRNTTIPAGGSATFSASSTYRPGAGWSGVTEAQDFAYQRTSNHSASVSVHPLGVSPTRTYNEPTVEMAEFITAMGTTVSIPGSVTVKNNDTFYDITVTSTTHSATLYWDDPNEILGGPALLEGLL